MIYFIIIVSFILFLFMPQEVMIGCGVSTTSLSHSLCYMFMHASWLHLIINMLSTLIMIVPIERIYIRKYNNKPTAIHHAAYFAAVIAGLFCAVDVPTVGMSGCTFFLLGVLLMLNPTKRQAKNYIWVLAAVIVQIYFGKSNVALHIVAFIEGALFIIIKEFFYQRKHADA